MNGMTLLIVLTLLAAQLGLAGAPRPVQQHVAAAIVGLLVALAGVLVFSTSPLPWSGPAAQLLPALISAGAAALLILGARVTRVLG